MESRDGDGLGSLWRESGEEPMGVRVASPMRLVPTCTMRLTGSGATPRAAESETFAYSWRLGEKQGQTERQKMR